MNIYEKIQNIKEEFLKSNIKKSGENKFAGFKYYELSDITPKLIELCNKYKVFSSFSFNKEIAILELVNVENTEEKVIYTSPMEELELKGCNKIQALGGTETYQRRYLYMSAFDIIENDMFDAMVSENVTVKNKEVMITEKQKEKIKEMYSNDEIKDYLETVKKKKLSDLTLVEASNFIKFKVEGE